MDLIRKIDSSIRWELKRSKLYEQYLHSKATPNNNNNFDFVDLIQHKVKNYYSNQIDTLQIREFLLYKEIFQREWTRQVFVAGYMAFLGTPPPNILKNMIASIETGQKTKDGINKHVLMIKKTKLRMSLWITSWQI